MSLKVRSYRGENCFWTIIWFAWLTDVEEASTRGAKDDGSRKLKEEKKRKPINKILLKAKKDFQKGINFLKKDF